MSDAEQEPSMEEILASIRRIISDDNEQGETNEMQQAEEETAAEEEVAAEEEEVRRWKSLCRLKSRRLQHLRLMTMMMMKMRY